MVKVLQQFLIQKSEEEDNEGEKEEGDEDIEGDTEEGVQEDLSPEGMLIIDLEGVKEEQQIQLL